MPASGEAQRQLPQYLCHKKVWALEIANITENDVGEQWMIFADEGYAPRLVKGGLFSRYTPEPGDFWVQYADGYESISPRKAFLEGYSPIDHVSGRSQSLGAVAPAGDPG